MIYLNGLEGQAAIDATEAVVKKAETDFFVRRVSRLPRFTAHDVTAADATRSQLLKGDEVRSYIFQDVTGNRGRITEETA